MAERCNLNCTYCYFFNQGDTSYKDKSPKITHDTIVGLSKYLSYATGNGDIDCAQLIFHGGEPLLLGKKRFVEVCSYIRANHTAEKVEFCLQTNATLVDAEWIDIFEHFDVKICTSLDGPPHVHDLRRIDLRGRGSYNAARRGIDLLLSAFYTERLKSVACLAVIQPTLSGQDIYEHLVHSVGFRQIDFLFPDVTHDSCSNAQSAYGDFLVSVFDAWIRQDDAGVNIRILMSIMSVLLGGKSYLAGFGSAQPNAFTLRSDGTVELDDFLRVCGADTIATNMHISALDKIQMNTSSPLSALNSEFMMLPVDCEGCLFNVSCRGGQITHRYSRDNGFRNASIFCDDLFLIFTHVAKFLLRNGINVPGLPFVEQGLGLPGRPAPEGVLAVNKPPQYPIPS